MRTETEQAPGFMGQVAGGLRRTVASPGRRWLLGLTLLVGGAYAGLVVALAPMPSLAALAGPAQLLMSVLVPLTGVLLAHDLIRHRDRLRAAPLLVAAAAYAAGVAVAGFALCVLATAVAPVAELGELRSAASVALGGIGVQVTAQLVGTGFGLLLRRTVVAFLATIVVPLGAWLLLGTADPLTRLQQWLTPFGANPPLLAGAPGATDLAAWTVVLVLWGGLLNGLGVRRHPSVG